jgi:hypothetical protein
MEHRQAVAAVRGAGRAAPGLDKHVVLRQQFKETVSPDAHSGLIEVPAQQVQQLAPPEARLHHALAPDKLQDEIFVDLAALAPGKGFRRLQGTSGQDAETNDGQPVGQTVTLAPLDGLFLRQR